MAEITLEVTETMAEFIQWVNEQGEDKIRAMVREYLAKIKAEHEVSKESHVDEGYKWDDALEPNDDVNQWKHGGDCNLCRKASYCLTKCRANKLLKKLVTPMLYEAYVEANPEAVTKNMTGIDPDVLAKNLGLVQ